MRHPRPGPVLVLLIACVGFVAAGCGSGTGATTSDRPTGRATGANASVFKALSRYPRSHAVSSRTRSSDGTLAQSFTVEGATTKAILEYYADVLPREGWTATSGPAKKGAVAWRGTWRQKDRTLAVSSAPAPAAKAQSDATTSQYSFVLTPAGAATP